MQNNIKIRSEIYRLQKRLSTAAKNLKKLSREYTAACRERGGKEPKLTEEQRETLWGIISSVNFISESMFEICEASAVD